MNRKVLYEKRGEVAYVTLNRPECKNAVDYETHLLLCEAWKDFRDDPKLRVAILTGTGDAFTAGADLKTHAPEWQKVGPMVGRGRLEDGLSGITRGPLSRITKPIVAAINGWCLGHGIELSMACDIRIASERAQFGTFEVRRGMHSADGGIVRLLNVCGAGVALEMVLTGEPMSAQRALMANMLSRVVSLDFFGSFGLMPLGLALSAGIAGLASPSAIIASGAIVSAAIIAGVMTRPWLRAVD